MTAATVPAAAEAQAKLFAIAADSAMRRGDHERAVEYLTRAVGLDPQPLWLERIRVIQDLEHDPDCWCAACEQARAADVDHHRDYVAGVV